MKTKMFDIPTFEEQYGLKPLNKKQKKLVLEAVSKINEGFAAMIDAGLPPHLAVQETMFQCFELPCRTRAFTQAYMKQWTKYIHS